MIAPLLPAHHDDAIALWHAAGLTRPWNDPRADLERALTGPASDVLAATAEGTVLGTVMVGHDGHRGWVYYVAVAESARGTGIGTALMSAAEDWLRDRGIPKLMLMVRADNVAVHGFYEAHGYAAEDVVVRSKWLDRG